MADTRVIAVVGATGAQGGGLARAILSDPRSDFAVRALTRKPESERAKELAALGAEVVRADLDDPESVAKAFEGCYGAYCVTNFWEHFSADREIAQAQGMAEAARRAGLEHVIWSTFEDTRRWIPLEDERMPTLQERFKVPHFDGKAEADRFFAESVPTTLLLTSAYWENLIYFGWGPQRGADGRLAITYPMGDKKLPAIAAEDIGRCALGIFSRGKELVGRTVGVAGEHLTGAEMAAKLTAALGEEVVYNDVSPDEYRAFGFPGADEIGNMFQFKRDCNDAYCGARDVGFSRQLNPELQTFEQWLARNKDRIPIQ